MKKLIVLYGIALAALIVFLRAIEYNYLVEDLSIEIYVGLVATIFAGVGIWAGLKLTSRKSREPEPQFAVAGVSSPIPTETSQELVEQFGISKREREVLDLIAQGLSNQEIADKLFVSLHTVKKHSSSLFSKLDVKRRTQAIEKAKRLGMLS